VLDGADMMLRFLLVRHKSLLGPPSAWKCADACVKRKHLDIHQAYSIIQNDWKQSNNKGYYITGKLNTTIYRDDCFFNGPDPDMSVKGLRKYLNAASQLFDQGKSRAELLSLDIVSVSHPSNHDDNTECADEQVIVARWRMNGVLRLPWKPKLHNWTGTTTYHFDADGLIFRHEETWDMSVAQAFLRTMLPGLADRIWGSNARRPTGAMAVSSD
jgi:hypothetical protein